MIAVVGALFVLTIVLTQYDSKQKQNKIESHEAKLEDLKETEDSLRDSLNDMNDKVFKSEEEIKAIKKENKDLKEKHSKAKKKAEEVEKKNEELVKKVSIKEAKKKEELKAKEKVVAENSETIKKVSEKKTVTESNSSQSFKVEATAYSALCNTGCSGITRTGVDVRNTVTYNGMRIIAVDPNVIPLWSTVRVSVGGNTFNAVALDTGGAIQGNRIDYLVNSKSKAYKFGRQSATVTITGNIKN